jgi:hypothetical protein
MAASVFCLAINTADELDPLLVDRSQNGSAVLDAKRLRAASGGAHRIRSAVLALTTHFR